MRTPLLPTAFVAAGLLSTAGAATERPHIVLVMADDMGWGQTGYYQHPVLKTPNLDGIDLQPLFAKDLQLYNLSQDPAEAHNIATARPDLTAKYRKAIATWNDSVTASIAGKDYPEGSADPNQPPSRAWTGMDEYRPYFPKWKSRPEYAGQLRKAR